MSFYGDAYGYSAGENLLGRVPGGYPLPPGGIPQTQSSNIYGLNSARNWSSTSAPPYPYNYHYSFQIGPPIPIPSSSYHIYPPGYEYSDVI